MLISRGGRGRSRYSVLQYKITSLRKKLRKQARALICAKHEEPSRKPIIL